MKDIHFRVWHVNDRRMYFRGYQRWFTVVLCEDDAGLNGGRGRPVGRARYADCVFLEGTGVFDRNGREIFEGDVLELRAGALVARELVGAIPDTFGSAEKHPLEPILKRHGLRSSAGGFELEILGNVYETPALEATLAGGRS